MSDDQQPEPYSQLVARIAKAETDNVILRELVSAIKAGSEGRDRPEITISHDMLADGTWRYKTSVTLSPETAEALPETLAYVDAIARQEAVRRESQDAAEGRNIPKAARVKAPSTIGGN